GDPLVLAQDPRLPRRTAPLGRVAGFERRDLGAVRDLPGGHAASDAVLAGGAADAVLPQDAGDAAADEGAAEAVQERPREADHRDAQTAEGRGLQPGPGLPAHVHPDPGVPRAVSRTALVQPDGDA